MLVWWGSATLVNLDLRTGVVEIREALVVLRLGVEADDRLHDLAILRQPPA